MHVSLIFISFLGAAHAQTNASLGGDFKDWRFYPLDYYLQTKVTNVSLTIGDASNGVLYEYHSGSMFPRRALNLASGSKWPAATAILLPIGEGKLGLDDPLSKWLPWWTSDPSDARSQVTVRHSLSMTTGMVSDGTDYDLALNDTDARKELANRAFGAWGKCAGSHLGTEEAAAAAPSFEDCVKAIYDAVPTPLYTPGSKFIYGSLSFQLAAAAAAAATGQPVGVLLQQLLDTCGMSHRAKWADQDTLPLLGGGLSASNEDMDRFSRAMLGRNVLPRWLHNEQERPQVGPGEYSSSNYYFGAYGLGNWLECLFGCTAWGVSPVCLDRARHSHPGCGGYWDTISRKGGWYVSFLPDFSGNALQDVFSSLASGVDDGKPVCPELYGPAVDLRLALQGFLDDIFGA